MLCDICKRAPVSTYITAALSVVFSSLIKKNKYEKKEKNPCISVHYKTKSFDKDCLILLEQAG